MSQTQPIASSIDKAAGGIANAAAAGEQRDLFPGMRPTRPIASSIDKAIVEIDRRRRAAGISIAELLRRARMPASSWWNYCKGVRPTAGSLMRLTNAVNGQVYAPPPPALITVLYRLCVAIIARERGVAPETIAACDFVHEKPNSPAWLAAARVRRLAMYVLTVEIEIDNATLARAIGCSRQNIKQARDAVEEWRDADPALDALIIRVADLAKDAAR